jgi:hypothetical protein
MWDFRTIKHCTTPHSSPLLAFSSIFSRLLPPLFVSSDGTNVDLERAPQNDIECCYQESAPAGLGEPQKASGVFATRARAHGPNITVGSFSSEAHQKEESGFGIPDVPFPASAASVSSTFLVVGGLHSRQLKSKTSLYYCAVLPTPRHGGETACAVRLTCFLTLWESPRQGHEPAHIIVASAQIKL